MPHSACLVLHQLLRSTNDWWIIARGTANRLDARSHGRVRNMRAIPSEKIVHPMNGCGRHMEGVGSSLQGQRSARQQRSTECKAFVRDIKFPHSAQESQSLGRGIGVPRAGLVHHDLRYKQVESPAALLPPSARQHLITRDDQIAAGPAGEIAGNGGFQIDGGHPPSLPTQGCRASSRHRQRLTAARRLP